MGWLMIVATIIGSLIIIFWAIKMAGKNRREYEEYLFKTTENSKEDVEEHKESK